MLSVLLVFLHWRRLRAKPCPGPGTRIKQVAHDDGDDDDEDDDDRSGHDNSGASDGNTYNSGTGDNDNSDDNVDRRRWWR